jgi:hypothetical protein
MKQTELRSTRQTSPRAVSTTKFPSVGAATPYAWNSPPRSETNSGLVVRQSLGGKRDDIGPRQLLEHSSPNAIGIWNTVNGKPQASVSCFLNPSTLFAIMQILAIA